MKIQEQFEKRWDCEVEEHSDLAPIKDAMDNGHYNRLGEAVRAVQENQNVERTLKSGVWMFRVIWNEKEERPQICCYSYTAGITYEGDAE